MSILNGLAEAGKTLSNFAGMAGLEGMRAQLEEGRIELAARLRDASESRGRAEGFQYSKTLQDDRLAAEAPGREASTDLAKAQADASRTTAGIAAKKDARTDAGITAAGGGAGDSYATRVAGFESGGKDNVPNALGSGAYGRYQIMPATWAEIRKEDPSLPEDMKQASPEQHKAAFDRFTAKNAETLQKAGIEPTAANLYLAHRFGAAGAQKVLRADDSAALGTVLPPEWQAQNPDMQGKTVGDFKRMAEDRMKGVTMDGGAGGVSDMPPDMRRSREALRLAGDLDKVAELDARWALEQNKRSMPTPGERARAQMGHEPPKEVQIFKWFRDQSGPDQQRFMALINEKRDNVDTKVENGQIINIDKKTGQQIGKAVPIEGYTPAMPEAAKKFASDVTSLNDAINRFYEVTKENPNSLGAYLNDPRDPKGQQVRAAFDNLKMLARTEAFQNTGVLQPHEVKMLQEDWLAPGTLRGLAASPEAYAAKFREFQDQLEQRLATRYKIEGAQPPKDMQFKKIETQNSTGAEDNRSGFSATGGPQGPSATPRIASQEAWAALSPGTIYMAPDGTMRTKR